MKKDQIIARFRALFPDVKLSNKRLNALSVKLEAKDLQDEAAIDAQLHAANDLLPFEEIAASDDTIANLNHKLKTTGKPAPKEGDEPQPPPDEMPAWFKPFAEKITKQEADKAQQSIQQKLAGHEKLKDINKAFWAKRALPAKEDDIDAFVEEVTTDHAAFIQESGYGNIGEHKPPISTEKPVPGKGKVDADLIAFAKKQNDKATAIK